MDMQFYGANCIVLTAKGVRFVIDDNLTDLGLAKGVAKPDDVVLYTGAHADATGRVVIDGPGEYEVADVSITGIAARAHIDEPGQKHATMFKLAVGDLTVLVTGHVYPELTDRQLETIGLVDVMFVPVGGAGYTVDSIGALKLIKAIEPKLVIPTHYEDKAFNYPVPQQDLSAALKDIGMEPKERVTKLRLKPGELSDVTQLVVLERA